MKLTKNQLKELIRHSIKEVSDEFKKKKPTPPVPEEPEQKEKPIADIPDNPFDTDETEESIKEIDFKSGKAFKAYKAKHKMRGSTKVNIAGKDTTVDKAKEKGGDDLNKTSDHIKQMDDPDYEDSMDDLIKQMDQGEKEAGKLKKDKAGAKKKSKYKGLGGTKEPWSRDAWEKEMGFEPDKPVAKKKKKSDKPVVKKKKKPKKKPWSRDEWEKEMGFEVKEVKESKRRFTVKEVQT